MCDGTKGASTGTTEGSDCIRGCTGARRQMMCNTVKLMLCAVSTNVLRNRSPSPFDSQRRPPRQQGARGCLGKCDGGNGNRHLQSKV